jgi:lipid A disaccharide synthetase
MHGLSKYKKNTRSFNIISPKIWMYKANQFIKPIIENFNSFI